LKVSSVTISYGPNDGSDVRLIVEDRSPLFLDIEKITNDQEASEQIKMLDLDILIDITGHTYNGRIGISAFKPAPVVINYLGFPGSSGCVGVDYSMVDRKVVSPEVAHNLFNEGLIYLPYSYQVNSMPLEVAPVILGHIVNQNGHEISNGNDSSREDTNKKNESITDHIISLNNRIKLCNFNTNKKMEPISFSVWMNIMRIKPSSILVLLEMTIDAKMNFLREVQYHGVSPSRLYFVPNLSWKGHLERISIVCDFVLDTFVYGAHTTASDMLWMSVPIITLQSWGSGRMPSKVASSIISSMQRMDVDNDVSIAHEGSIHSISASDAMVTYNVRDYESTAVSFSNCFSTVIRLKHLILSLTLIAPTFDTKIMQNSIEYACQVIKDVSTISPLFAGITRTNHSTRRHKYLSQDIEGDARKSSNNGKEMFHIIVGKPNSSMELDIIGEYSIEENQSINCLGELIIAEFKNDIDNDNNHVFYDFCSLLSESDRNMLVILSQPMATRIKATLSFSSTYNSTKKINRSSIIRILR
jgi:hypothetical protein